jgi:ATP-dependent Clp protease protease subunit
MNTIITEKTEHGEVAYDVFSKLVESRILFVYGFVEDAIATDVAATLMFLDSQDDKSEISLYLNTEGGDVRSIFMIYDIMKMITSPIKTYCMGSSVHEAALLLAAGAKGKRYATASSTICLSQLNHEGSHVSDIKNAEARFQQSKKDNDKFISALAYECGKSIKSVMKDIDQERYFSLHEAKKYGIIDCIVGEKEIKKDVKSSKV